VKLVINMIVTITQNKTPIENAQTAFQ